MKRERKKIIFIEVNQEEKGFNASFLRRKRLKLRSTNITLQGLKKKTISSNLKALLGL